jgi:hypothetical protein
MELVTVSSRYFEARDEIGKVLPESLSPAVRELILNMARSIADPIEMPD